MAIVAWQFAERFVGQLPSASIRGKATVFALLVALINVGLFYSNGSPLSGLAKRGREREQPQPEVVQRSSVVDPASFRASIGSTTNGSLLSGLAENGRAGTHSQPEVVQRASVPAGPAEETADPASFKVIFGDATLAWADKYIASQDQSDFSMWPPIKVEEDSGPWPGLHRPRVYCVSLAKSIKRRLSFVQEFHRSIKFKFEHAEWMPGIPGFDVPVELRNPNGNAARGAEKDLQNAPGIFGCDLSHFQIYRHSFAKCQECDVVIFEDDAVLHPNFTKLWTEFVSVVPSFVALENSGKRRAPPALLHFCGEDLWEPPREYNPDFMVSISHSKSCGYVVKSKYLNALMDYYLSVRPAEAVSFAAIDVLLGGGAFTSHFPVVTPRVPFAHPAQKDSNTDPATYKRQDNTDNGVSKLPPDYWSPEWPHNCWHATWIDWPQRPCVHDMFKYGGQFKRDAVNLSNRKFWYAKR